MRLRPNIGRTSHRIPASPTSIEPRPFTSRPCVTTATSASRRTSPTCPELATQEAYVGPPGASIRLMQPPARSRDERIAERAVVDCDRGLAHDRLWKVRVD